MILIQIPFFWLLDDIIHIVEDVIGHKICIGTKRSFMIPDTWETVLGN